MSHHNSGPLVGFPNGDGRLDSTNLYAFPKPGGATRSILLMEVRPSFSIDPPGSTTSIPFAPEAIYELRVNTDRDNITISTSGIDFSPFTSDEHPRCCRSASCPHSGVGDRAG